MTTLLQILERTEARLSWTGGSLPIQLPPSNLAFAVATVQLYQKHRNHIWTRFWIPCWHFTTWNLKVGVEFSAVQSALPRFVSFDNIDPWCIGARWCVVASGREVEWTRWLGLDCRLAIATSKLIERCTVYLFEQRLNNGNSGCSAVREASCRLTCPNKWPCNSGRFVGQKISQNMWSF